MLTSVLSPRAPQLSGWIATQCARESLTPDGFGARIWAAADHGDITHDQAPRVVRSLLTAGTSPAWRPRPS